DEDVHLRVTEQPEQVLPQERRSAGLAHVEVRAEEAVKHQEREPDRDHRKRRDDQELRDEGHPGERREAHHLHPGRAHVEDGDDEVESRSEEHTSELQSLAYLVCRLLLETKKLLSN